MNRESLASATELHWGNCTRTIGPRGGIKSHSTVCRVNGALKTWKTRPEDFRLPIKHGMRGYGEVVPANIHEFHTPEECPLSEAGEVANDKHVTRIQPVTFGHFGERDFHRVVCTCGYVGEAHFTTRAAEEDADRHAWQNFKGREEFIASRQAAITGF